MQFGRVFESGGRALDRAIIFCAKCAEVYRERADALCCGIPAFRASQLRKLRSGLFPNKCYPGWTVEDVRQPSLDEATTLVAQLESCEVARRQRWNNGNASPGTWPCSAATRVRMGSTVSWCRHSPATLRAEVRVIKKQDTEN